MARRTSKFLKEFVILFGFLNGVWLAVGVNPGAELLGVLRGTLEGLVSGSWVSFLFSFIPIVLLLLTFWPIFLPACWVGFFAVGSAFLCVVSLCFVL